MGALQRFEGQLERIPQRMHSIFLPQLEQLGAEPVPVRYGVLGRIRGGGRGGWFWGCSPADDTVVTVVNMVADEDIPLREAPEVRYSVIGLMCRSSLRMMDQIWAQEDAGAGGTLRALSAPVAGEREEVAAFWMEPREYVFEMERGCAHYGTSLHLLPEFFERMEREAPGEFSGMPAAIARHPDLTGALELRGLLRRLTPAHANVAGAGLYYRGLALQIAAAFNAYQPPSGRTDGDLVARAKALVAETLDRPASLDELASALFVSRTRLCEQFRRETGMSVGAFRDELRMRRAKELLSCSDTGLSEIARQVGYAHQSTFTAAFKRATGTTPRTWRRKWVEVPGTSTHFQSGGG